MMKKMALLLAVLVVLLVGVSVTVAAADQYPNGCADCHKGDKSLSATVKAIAKHPPVAATADVNTCLKCHKAGTKLALNTKMHDSHTKAKIGCTACHTAAGSKDLKGKK
jgi:nitrate/TMAO reductase-like tetraheme cytochrome c subunit